MISELSITETRRQLTHIDKDLGAGDVLVVTRNEKKLLAMMTYELYKGLAETLGILGDEELRNQIRRRLDDISKDRLIDLQDIEKSLGAP